jgi:hypothetical protein
MGKTLELPSVDEMKTKPVERKPKEEVPKPVVVESATAEIVIPFLQQPRQYDKKICDVRNMTAEQSHNLRCLLRGLEFSGATLKNGGRVQTGQHVVKWILENLSI